jgi:hypothetical protein
MGVKLAQLVKAIIDTPILAENGELLSEASSLLKVISNSSDTLIL